MRRVRMPILILTLILMVAATALLVVGSSPQEEEGPGTTPLAEHEVVVLTSTRDLDTKDRKYLGWFYDVNDNLKLDGSEQEFSGGGTVFSGAPKLRKDLVLGIAEVYGYELANVPPHPITRFELSNGTHTILAVHRESTLYWWVSDAMGKREALPTKRLSYDRSKIPDEFTLFTSDLADQKTDLRIWVEGKPIKAKAIKLILP